MQHSKEKSHHRKWTKSQKNDQEYSKLKHYEQNKLYQYGKMVKKF